MFILCYVILFNLTYLKLHAQNLTSNNHAISAGDAKLLIENLKRNANISVCQIEGYPINNNAPELRIPQSNPICHKTYINNFITIKHGYIRYKFFNPTVTCKYQCNYPDGELKITVGKWRNINRAKPDCDVFEVQCTTTFWPHILLFQDLYFQVAKKKIKKPEKITFLKESYNITNINNKYNVHLIVIDSVSYYMAKRGLENTIDYLEKEYSASLFKMNNKIGLNSRPNAHGFLLNRRINSLRNFLNIEKVKPSDYITIRKNDCDEYLDDQPFIINYYRQLNYTILSGEDSSYTAFVSGNCKGFKKHFAHHTTRPYALKLFNPNYSQSNKFLKIHESKCLGYSNYQFDYLANFMKTYKDSKQFTFTWITHISHEKPTGHYQYDNYFKRFFKNHKHLFDNGFLIFMADHGFRTGKYRSSEIGAFEDKNPFLIISPPKALRTNSSEVLKNLKINANKHTSHFDIYATMLDILTEGSRTNFSNMSYFNFTNIIKNDTIKGSSLLRELNGNRTCYSMEITSEHCLCREKFTNYDGSLSQLNENSINTTRHDDPLVKNIKKLFVNALNDKLNKSGLTKYCEMLSENENGEFKLQYLYNVEKKIIFYIKQEVLPKGIFEAYLNEDGKIISDSIERLDRYAKYAEVCVPNHTDRMFCYCKSLISKNLEKLSTKRKSEISGVFNKPLEDIKNFFKNIFKNNI
uniref:Sulfatase domain-containing protein n=1 Tax=Strongyloides venezuelensis TaxID=75913 RepID=A0A0K0F409_STRVS